MTEDEINISSDNALRVILDGAEILGKKIFDKNYFEFDEKQKLAIQGSINYLRKRAYLKTPYSWGTGDKFIEAAQIKYLKQEEENRLTLYYLKRDEYLRNHKAI